MSSYAVWILGSLSFGAGYLCCHYLRLQPFVRDVEAKTEQLQAAVDRLKGELAEQKAEMDERLSAAVEALRQLRRAQATYRTPGGEP